MTKREMAEKILEMVASQEGVEKASKTFAVAWDKACDESEVPAATTALVMAAAAAVSGAPSALQVMFAKMFADSLNILAEREVVAVGTVQAVKRDGGREPMGFRPTQPGAKC